MKTNYINKSQPKSSTSLPGGNQVDVLPPAPSFGFFFDFFLEIADFFDSGFVFHGRVLRIRVLGIMRMRVHACACARMWASLFIARCVCNFNDAPDTNVP